MDDVMLSRARTSQNTFNECSAASAERGRDFKTNEAKKNVNACGRSSPSRNTSTSWTIELIKRVPSKPFILACLSLYPRYIFLGTSSHE